MKQQWTQEEYLDFLEKLYLLQDEKYKIFHERLLLSSLKVMGIRVPELRRIGKEIGKQNPIKFLEVCGSATHEERMLYGFVVSGIQEYEIFLQYCDKFAYESIENWALTDGFSVSLKNIVSKNEVEFFQHVKGYLVSENPWVIRLGFIILLSHYLKEPYFQEILELNDTVKEDFYYVEMGQAWLLATAWSKDRNKVKGYILKSSLSASVKKKFVQKARDSFRISQEDKDWLRAWRDS